MATPFVIMMQVLGKCQLLEAVQEKEQGLDSLGRKFHLHMRFSFRSSFFLFLRSCENSKLYLSHFKVQNRMNIRVLLNFPSVVLGALDISVLERNF